MTWIASLRALKRCLGLVPQEFNFNQFEKAFDIVVTQAGYYGIPRREAQGARRAVPDPAGAYGTSTMWRPACLSGGMKRRLMIARALVHQPRLLILDEPTAGVDIELRRSMWSFLTELNEQGVTIILTTHYLEEAEQLCRNIAHHRPRADRREHQHEATCCSSCMSETFLLDLKDAQLLPPQLHGYRSQLIDAHTLEVQVDKEQGINRVVSPAGAAEGRSAQPAQQNQPP
jgi:ABC-2 type transport system ATP-binding protein